MSQATSHTTPNARPMDRPKTLAETIHAYMGLIRFSHTIFALPFALLASIWAWLVPVSSRMQSINDTPSQAPSFHVLSLLGVLLCMVTGRSFAMAVNRLLDQRWDAANPRTANRHLPAQILQRKGVIIFSIACVIGFVASCTLFIPNWLPLILCGPVLLFLAGYSLAKRFTYLVHFWLGTALMLAPVCAWIAIRGQYVQSDLPDILPAITLGCVVLFWVAGFDIIYACQDAEFDKRSGLYSIPAKLGIRAGLWVARLSHAIMCLFALALVFCFPQLSLGWLFLSSLAVIASLLVYEHYVVSDSSLDRMQLAFFQLNSIISVVFLFVGGLDAYLR